MRRAPLVFALVAVFVLPVGTQSVSATDWASLCPSVVDEQPNSPQPRVLSFQFNATKQLFSRIDQTTNLPASSSMPLVGCYADLPMVNSERDITWQIGVVNRDRAGFYWRNMAGAQWRLTLDSSGEFLATDEANPYWRTGNRFTFFPALGVNPYSRGALGMVADLNVPAAKTAYIGTDPFTLPDREFGYGFSWYTNIWPLFTDFNKGMSASAGVTWLLPRTDELTLTQYRELCAPRQFDMQSMEGGPGWVDYQNRYPSLLPKYKFNPVNDCYESDSPATPGWTFSGEPIASGRITPLLLSNNLLVPPDGFVFSPTSAGGMLGIATMALPLRQLITQRDKSVIGDQAWTVFFRASNFSGPVVIYPPQLWAAFTKDNPIRRPFGLDRNVAYQFSGSMEWGGVPYAEYYDGTKFSYSRIPQMQFPVDANGETVFMSNFISYSKRSYWEKLEKALSEESEIGTAFEPSGGIPVKITVSSQPLYQSGKLITPFGAGKVSALQAGRAFGIKWPTRNTIEKPASTFKDVGQTRIPVDASLAPQALTNFSFVQTSVPTFTYETPPTWTFVKGSEVFSRRLTDGSTVQYTWVRFVDQPGVRALGLSTEESEKLQAVATRLQKAWSINPSFIGDPASGEIASLDDSLLVVPPSGLEFGYVPLVIRQTGPTSMAAPVDLLADPKSAYQRLLLRQNTPAAPAVTPSPTPTPSPTLTQRPTSKSITCIKGKVIKKVSGINPRCPKGYKLKK